MRLAKLGARLYPCSNLDRSFNTKSNIKANGFNDKPRLLLLYNLAPYPLS